MADEPVPNYLLRQIADDINGWFREADKRERDTEQNTRRLAEVHAKGWEQVAKAINDGFRLVAEAVRDRR